MFPITADGGFAQERVRAIPVMIAGGTYLAAQEAPKTRLLLPDSPSARRGTHALINSCLSGPAALVGAPNCVWAGRRARRRIVRYDVTWHGPKIPQSEAKPATLLVGSRGPSRSRRPPRAWCASIRLPLIVWFEENARRVHCVCCLFWHGLAWPGHFLCERGRARPNTADSGMLGGFS